MICGVDISSASLAARVGREGAAASFPNNPEGIAALAAFCQSYRVDLVAMEATGGYEKQAFARPANRPKSSASRWPTSCWCGSTPRPGKSGNGWLPRNRTAWLNRLPVRHTDTTR